MKTPLYRKALSHGWHLARHHSFLWVYGLFAAFLGQMGMLEFLSKVGFTTRDGFSYLSFLNPNSSEGLAGFAGAAADTKLLLIWLFVVLASLAVGLAFVSVVSQGAIIHAASESTKIRKKLPDAGVAWHVGVKHFWRLFAINLLKKGLLILLAVIVGSAALNALSYTTATGNIIFLLVFVLVGIAGLMLSFLVIYAAAYIVVEEYSFLDSIAGAWYLFKSHWLVSFEVGLIMILLNLLLGLALALGFVVLFFPALLIWFAAVVTASQLLLALGFVVSIVLFTGYIMLIGSIFTVFSTSVWTFLFMKMHKTGVKSRVLHWLSYSKA
jgi:hypothetical protein